MKAEDFVLEVVKIMVPLLTGFLVIFAKTVGKFWSEKDQLKGHDYRWAIGIAFFGFCSFGCWAGVLAAEMNYLLGTKTKFLWFTLSEDMTTLKLAGNFTAIAYSFLVITIFLAGAYYLVLLRASDLMRQRRNRSLRR